MSISSQLPPIPLALASASLRALAQAAGQTVEARVLAQANNGATHVQIGRQVVSLNLPQSQPVGATLTLSVQQADGQLRLTLEAVRLPASGQVLVSGPTQHTPATQVQLSPAALSGGTPVLNSAAGPAVQSSKQTQFSQAGGVSTAASVPVSRPGQSAPSPGPYGLGNPQSQSGGAVPAPVVGSATAPAGPRVDAAASLPPSAGTSASPASGSPIVRPTVATGAQSAPPPAMAAAAEAPAVSSAVTTASAASVNVRQAPTPLGQIGVSAPAAQVSASPPTIAMPRVDIHYAVAAPAVGRPVPVVSVVGSASTALPPVAETVPASVVGQHAPSPNPGGASTATNGPVQQVAAQVPAASSPQAALAQMVQQALPRQDSMVGLTTALTAAVSTFVLPEPVAKAAQQVLAGRVALDGQQVTGAALKLAVQKSGIFQEAMLAAGQGAQAAGDAKSALLGLRQSLGAWLGQQAPVAQVASVAPPLRGLLPRARAGDGGTPSLPDDVLEAGKILLERTDAALSRLRLHQSASIPEPHASRQDAQWSLDLPVVVAGQQHLLQMQIHKDPESEGDRPEGRGWQIRFAINLSDAGEIGAQISLRANTAGVLLWADRAETAAMLAEDAEGLKEALSGVGLTPGAVVIRTGAPMPAPKMLQAQPYGQNLDATR